MNKKVVVLGRGLMGTVIAKAMRQFENRVWTFDITHAHKTIPLNDNIIKYPCDVHCDVVTNIRTVINYIKPDIVISALPYTVNTNVADVCVTYKTPYCDLGGEIIASEYINDIGAYRESCVFTDLGLAPGLVNIIAVDMLKKRQELNVHTETIEMYCGGIPLIIENPLKYMCTWSTQGLYNEYKDNCNILKNREIIEVNGLDGHGDSPIPGLECFYTSGGVPEKTLEFFKTNDVTNAFYKTLRYSGHRDIIKLLVDNLDANEFGKVVKGADKLNILKDDVVKIFVRLTGDDKVDSISHTIYSNKSFSAMQIGTALPCACVAQWMLETDLPKRPLGYHDIDIKLMYKNMNKLGLVLTNGE